MAKIEAQRKRNVGDLVSLLKDEQAKDVSLIDVMQFAEVMANSLHSFFETLDASLYKEFRDIASFIADMRSEIGKLQANDLRTSRIPRAGEELDAIVESTEQATHQIMESAETIMGADPDDHDSYVETVNEHIMKIFEACSFQDLTGQRISRVVETLTLIEDRVGRFAEAIGPVGDEDRTNEEESEREKRRRELLLHGPQNKGDAIEQNAVDALLSEQTEGSDQAAIDSLFD